MCYVSVINITVPLFTIIQGYSSYMQYPAPIAAVESFDVAFQFKLDNGSTSRNDSLLVYTSQNEFLGDSDDFFAVGLKHSRVVLQFSLGSGIARISSEPLDMSKEWHTVGVGRNGRQGYLYVDGVHYSGRSPPPLTGLNVNEPLFIGGVPNRQQLSSVLDFQSGGFHGSVYDVSIRFSRKQPFIALNSSKEWAVVKGRNVGDESYDECSQSDVPLCANGGNCSTQGAAVLCLCPEKWVGLYCDAHQVPCYRYNPCKTGDCRPDGPNATCDCPLGKTGHFCDDGKVSVQQ